MDRHGKELILKEETHRVVGCAMEVLNELGNGLHEKLYENAMVVEFGLRGIPHEQQRSFKVLYKNVYIGEYIPDLICFGALVVDAKIVDRIQDREIAQILNYLRITGFRVGLLLNFKAPNLSGSASCSEAILKKNLPRMNTNSHQWEISK